MINKFWYLTKLSINKKMKTKAFLIANILLLVGIIAVVNIDSIISFFGGDFDQTNEIVIIDNTNSNATDIFKKNMEDTNTFLDEDYETKYEIAKKSEKEILKEIEDKDEEKILIVFNETTEDYLTAKVASVDYISTSYYQMIVQALTQTKAEIAMAKTDIDKEELTKITSLINIDRKILNEDKNSEEENMDTIMGAVFPTLILPFFMLVIVLVQMIGAEINEEKSTRSMEVIISNVSPKVHFFSKILASNLFVIVQGGLLIAYAGIAILLKSKLGGGLATSQITQEIGNIWDALTSSGFVDKLYYIIPVTLVLMVLSFIAYSLVAGIFASMTVNQEDFQHIQTPIMMILLVGYYLAIMAGMFDGSILIKILSYIPFISALLAPALLIIGQIGVIDVIISIGLLVLLDFLMMKYGLRIYKVGILNYSTDKMFRKIFKAAKQKEV